MTKTLLVFLSILKLAIFGSTVQDVGIMNEQIVTKFFAILSSLVCDWGRFFFVLSDTSNCFALQAVLLFQMLPSSFIPRLILTHLSVVNSFIFSNYFFFSLTTLESKQHQGLLTYLQVLPSQKSRFSDSQFVCLLYPCPSDA